MVAGREAIMDFLRPHVSNESEEIDLFLSLQEALANAVMHGSRNDPSAQIRCAVTIDPSAFTVVVRDPGRGFDPQSIPRLTENVGNHTESGRGICLMRSLMDEVTYSRNGSEVLLRKLRTAPPQASPANE